MSPLREYLEQYSIPEPNSGCWLWTRSINVPGYGQGYWNGKVTGAHRLSWVEANKREIPSGMDICHKCDVKTCVNPAHLFLGTRKENLADMTRKGRRNMKASVWLKGERNGGAKLSAEQVRAIRADVRHRREIAADYGIRIEQVYRILNRTRWTHV